MKKMKKSLTSDDGDSSYSFSHFPDEILVQILNKIVDLKTLCHCKLVSKRIYSVVLQVDTISFIPTLIDRHPQGLPCGPRYRGLSLRSMNRFTRLKCLHIELPVSSKCVTNGSFFKWRIKFSQIIDSFVFLSQNSVYDKNNGIYVNGNGNEVENWDLLVKKLTFVYACLADAITRLRMSFSYIINFPLLETISITDSSKRGTVSVTGTKMVEVTNWLNSPSHETVQKRVTHCKEGPRKQSRCYIPLLELPVSGYIMKGVTLFLFERDDIPDDGDYSFIKRDLDDDKFKDKEEAAYNEAMMEILNNHRDLIQRL